MQRAGQQYRVIGDLLTYINPRIMGHSQFLLRDAAPPSAPRTRAYWSTYQSGLYSRSGTSPSPPPTLYAFPFLAATTADRSGDGRPDRHRSGAVPGSGPTFCRRAPGLRPAAVRGRPTAAATVVDLGTPISVTNGRGYFAATLETPGPGAMRAVWQGRRARVWPSAPSESSSSPADLRRTALPGGTDGATSTIFAAARLARALAAFHGAAPTQERVSCPSSRTTACSCSRGHSTRSARWTTSRSLGADTSTRSCSGTSVAPHPSLTTVARAASTAPTPRPTRPSCGTPTTAWSAGPPRAGWSCCSPPSSPDAGLGVGLPRLAQAALATCQPDYTQFKRFVQALGTRYSGEYADENQGRRVLPRVERWSVWNEPNQGGWLQPQYARSTAGRRPRRRRSTASSCVAALKGLRASGHSRRRHPASVRRRRWAA